MEVRYQLRYSPANRIYVPPETRDSIPAASPSSHQPGRRSARARCLPAHTHRCTVSIPLATLPTQPRNCCFTPAVRALLEGRWFR